MSAGRRDVAYKPPGGHLGGVAFQVSSKVGLLLLQCLERVFPHHINSGVVGLVRSKGIILVVLAALAINTSLVGVLGSFCPIVQTEATVADGHADLSV